METQFFFRINLFSLILLPLVTGIGGPASEGFPEVERLLTLEHRLLVIPWEDSDHCPRHLTLVPMTALASRSWVKLCRPSPPVLSMSYPLGPLGSCT